MENNTCILTVKPEYKFCLMNMFIMSDIPFSFKPLISSEGEFSFNKSCKERIDIACSMLISATTNDFITQQRYKVLRDKVRNL